jgi:hypothetical protein
MPFGPDMVVAQALKASINNNEVSSLRKETLSGIQGIAGHEMPRTIAAVESFEY